MKIKTNITAGTTFEQCAAQRDWWKNQAQMMETYQYDKSAKPPAGLWFPCMGSAANPGSGSSTAGGGYVAGVWVSDMSGICA